MSPDLSLSDFRNRVFPEDVLEVLKKLPDESIDMVYGDPDYGVGINYHGVKYTQKWEKYIEWYSELAKESMRVLKPNGNLFFINYPKQNSYLRVLCLDKLAYEVSDYAWVYNTNVGHSKRRLTTAHRSVLHAVKSKQNQFYKEQIALPYKNPNDKRIQQNLRNGSLGRMPYSWFYYDLVKNVSKDKTFHACQIPLKLVEMLIKSCTKKDDDCFILFGGSGSELVLCQQLERNFISCEIQEEYYQMIQDRIDKNGKIDDHYRLHKRAEKQARVSNEQQMRLMEKRTRYTRSKKTTNKAISATTG